MADSGAEIIQMPGTSVEDKKRKIRERLGLD